LPPPSHPGNVLRAEGGRDTAKTRRRIAWTTLIALTTAGAGMVSAGASAGSIAGQRSEAAAILHRIEVLDWRRTHMIAVERRSRARVRFLRSSIAGIDGAISSQQLALNEDQSALARLIVGDYKTSSTDTTAYVLSSNSFSDLIQRVDVLSRINSSSSELIRRIGVAQHMLAVQRRQLSAGLGAVAAQLARQQTAQHALEGAIAARRGVLAGIDAQIQSQLNAERSRRATLATQSGAAPPPESGGGQGGFTGEASWYGPGFAGQPTADGEIFDPNKLTAASPWLPFNTMLRVTDLATGRSVVVRVNDRGPFGRGVLDLSAHAAQIIGLGGWAEVQCTIL
jgi:rare lipoprotein A (peptidoglycan hydrolase)